MNELYLRINNGGVTFKAGVDENGKLAVGLSASHFGHTTNEMHICTDAESLRAIGEMMIKASEQDHEEYVFAAKAQKEQAKSTESANEVSE